MVEKFENVRQETRKLSFYWTKNMTGLHAVLTDAVCLRSASLQSPEAGGTTAGWSASLGGYLRSWGDRNLVIGGGRVGIRELC